MSGALDVALSVAAGIQPGPAIDFSPALAAMKDDDTLIVGPVEWFPKDEADENGPRDWRFAYVTGKYHGATYTSTSLTAGNTFEAAEDVRNAFLFAIVNTGKGLAIYDLDDSRRMVQMATAFWPGAKSAKWLSALDDERKN